MRVRHRETNPNGDSGNAIALGTRCMEGGLLMTTQRRKYRNYFEACLLVLGPIPPIISLKDIREQETYKIEAMAWWCETQNDQVTQKAAHRFWKAFRLWHIETVGPIRHKRVGGTSWKAGRSMYSKYSQKFSYPTRIMPSSFQLYNGCKKSWLYSRPWPRVGTMTGRWSAMRYTHSWQSINRLARYAK